MVAQVVEDERVRREREEDDARHEARREAAAERRQRAPPDGEHSEGGDRRREDEPRVDGEPDEQARGETFAAATGANWFVYPDTACACVPKRYPGQPARTVSPGRVRLWTASDTRSTERMLGFKSGSVCTSCASATPAAAA